METNRRNLILLFFTMVVIMLGFGIIIPILPFYIDAMGADGTDLGFLMAIFALMQLIFAPYWGSLSDKIGRKPVLIIGAFGNAISLVLMGLATEFWMLFAARALAGVLSSATIPTAMAYISDSTSRENRGGGMAVIGAAMGIGMILGPGVGGWLAAINLSYPFFLAGGLSLLVTILIFIILPESLAVEKRKTTGSKMAGPNFKAMWQALFGPLGFLMFLSFLLSFGLTSFEGIFGLYALEKHGYGPEQVGTILTVIGLVSAAVQMLLTGRLTRTFGEKKTIQGALAISVIGFILMLLPENFSGVLLTTGFFMIGQALLRPVLAAIISKQTDDDTQGMALGMHNSFMSLGRIAGPIWAGFIFDINTAYPFISGAIIMAMGLAATLLWLQEKEAPLQTAPQNQT